MASTNDASVIVKVARIYTDIVFDKIVASSPSPYPKPDAPVLQLDELNCT